MDINYYSDNESSIIYPMLLTNNTTYEYRLSLYRIIKYKGIVVQICLFSMY